MATLKRFSVSLESDLLSRFDDYVEREGYPTRSKAIADLMRGSLVEQQWAEGDEVAAAIILVYDHHKHQLSGQLTHVQHHYHTIVVSSQHIHLDYDNCLEIVLVRGEASQVKELARKLKTIKGVKYSTLASASTGQGL